jgi:hypothetical protein
MAVCPSTNMGVPRARSRKASPLSSPVAIN